MRAAHIEIRRLMQADAVLYRDIRLEALRAHPEAFGSTLETEAAQPSSWFALASSCLGGGGGGYYRYLVGNADPVTLAILRGIGKTPDHITPPRWPRSRS